MTQDYYYTIDKESVAEYKDRGSRFIACLYPVSSVEDAREKLAAIKKMHPKATHHCFAYRIGLDGNTFRVSDDGEPSGTAGRPILGQIDSKQVTNVLIVVVRYFGGALLGVPGLINAYKTSASLALQVTPLVQKPVLVMYVIQFDYTQMNEIMTIVKQFDCTVFSQEAQLFCRMELGIPRNREQEILFRFKELRNISFEKK